MSRLKMSFETAECPKCGKDCVETPTNIILTESFDKSSNKGYSVAFITCSNCKVILGTSALKPIEQQHNG